ncbi:MAG: type II toxin-antitoxin system Phd/YefM family antitoxin [Candidatus Vogelbacteria bacterium]|nr:type II toxin-antitoxin system Phd/YefM family antitoxin [Candidatus Vogelbacteria bacterium]
MEVISTTEARKRLGRLIEAVDRNRRAIGIGRRDKIEAIIIKYPAHLNPLLDPWTQFAANGGSFDFLTDEPELYSAKDVKRRYAKTG